MSHRQSSSARRRHVARRRGRAVAASRAADTSTLGRIVAWLGFALAVALLWIMLAPATARAQTTPPTDFSDMRRQLVQWPFDVIEYWTEEDEFNLYQLTRVQQSSHEVFNVLNRIKRNRGSIGGFMVRGATKQAEPGHYMSVLVDDDGRHFVWITPDGAGAVLKLKATPNAIVSGYFKRSLYGYNLGDGDRVDASRADNLDE